MGEQVVLTAADGHELAAYVARPEGVVRGAVVVVQEIFGVNAHIRSVADRFAAEGYVAIAPALFDRVKRGIELKYEGLDAAEAMGLMMLLNEESALEDIAAAFARVSGEGNGTAVVGFCYGGKMSWLAATRGEAEGMRPAGCVAYYPGGIGKVAEEMPRCAVMVHVGEADSHIGRDQIEALERAHPEVPVFLYPGAEHGFNCDARSAYNAEQAKVAWGRTMEFLAVHVG